MVVLLVEGMKAFLLKKVPEATVKKVMVPLMTVGFSVTLYIAFSYLYPPVVLTDCIIQGLILGFTSSGIYSIGKTMFKQYGIDTGTAA